MTKRGIFYPKIETPATFYGWRAWFQEKREIITR